jgi:hypothetical protein
MASYLNEQQLAVSDLTVHAAAAMTQRNDGAHNPGSAGAGMGGDATDGNRERGGKENGTDGSWTSEPAFSDGWFAAAVNGAAQGCSFGNGSGGWLSVRV